MGERPSMYTLRLRAEWLLNAWCPGCGAENRLPEHAPIEMNDEGHARCRLCKDEWKPRLDRQVER